LMPPSVFYRRRIAQEARTGEPELAVLAELVPRGGIAVDVGANIGFFAYALADIADRVLAFEPNPDYALFARWMLRDRAEVHEVALSDASGRGTLYVPLSDQGVLLHLAGSLKRSHFQFRNINTLMRRSSKHRARSAGPVPKAFRTIRAIERICPVECPSWPVIPAADSGNAAIVTVICCTFSRPTGDGLVWVFVH
jgi:FkbM family methyltransferase